MASKLLKDQGEIQLNDRFNGQENGKGKGIEKHIYIIQTTVD
jgi:hypothetical protein